MASSHQDPAPAPPSASRTDEPAIIPEVMPPDLPAPEERRAGLPPVKDGLPWRSSGQPPGTKSDGRAARPPVDTGSILHPLSGVLILFLDYAFFAGEALTAMLGVPLAAVLSFALSGIGIFLVQRHLAEDRTGHAVAKAFIGGVVTGIPTPITGTIFATFILALCGLNWLGRIFRGSR